LVWGAVKRVEEIGSGAVSEAKTHSLRGKGNEQIWARRDTMETGFNKKGNLLR